VTSFDTATISSLSRADLSTPEGRKSAGAEAARQFETTFVAELLKASGLDRSMGKGPYGSFVTQSLATTLTEGKGLGLSELITRALDEAK
jgi:Rod binding domain-containing protein